MITRKYIIGILSLTGLLSLAACSSEEYQPQEEKEMSIEISASSLPYSDEAAASRGVTRSGWTPPSGYSLYDALYDESFANFMTLSDKAIDVFFTQKAEDISGESPYVPLHGRLRYLSSQSKWKLAFTKIDPTTVSPGDYYVYGFIPKSAADNAEIALLPGSSTYEDGAVLTIKGMQTVAADACVIIGAKEGPDEDHDNGLRAGDFCLNLKNGNDGAGNPLPNYLYLLFDHLCSALSINMKVDATYNELRTIKLKELRMKTATERGLTKQKADVTITLHKTDDGSSPITDISYSAVGDEESNGLVFQSEEGLTLTTERQWFLGHFMPSYVTDLILVSTYDVYDKQTPKANLIRENCTAENRIDLHTLFRTEELLRRHRYTIDITVNPTYLYMLSDPDLDNPSMTVE